MENPGFIEKYPFLRQYWLPITLAFLGLIFLGYSMIGFFTRNQDEPDILYEAASTSANISETGIPQEKLITIDIEGAVQKPGVYKLPFDSRIQDALIAAGGLAKDADRERIVKGLNLAARLTDGGKLYIAFLGESDGGQSLSFAGSAPGDQSNLININSASISELDTLPGIGKTTAEKIINSRPYASVTDLIDKKIIGKKVFTDIESKITAQ